MAKFHRTENGTAWLEITFEELTGYSGMDRPICDECLRSLASIRKYPEDRPIEERREQFWKDYFGIREEAI